MRSKVQLLSFVAVLVAACTGGVTGSRSTGTSTTPFSCGTKVCKAGEYCQAATPGYPPGSGPGYTCRPYPASCPSSPTCDCIQAAELADHCYTHFSDCSDDGEGHFTIECGYP